MMKRWTCVLLGLMLCACGGSGSDQPEPAQQDTIAPVITLIGEATIEVYLGESFEDPGATASDNIDGDISEQIEVVGSVDTSTEGSYELSYQVSDAAGNAATPAVRTVSVVNPLSLSVTFPTALANIGAEQSMLTVIGHFKHKDSLEVSAQQIAMITVDGVEATITDTDRPIWQADVPLTNTSDSVTIVAEFSNGGEQQLQWTFRNQAPLTQTATAIAGENADAVLVVDTDLERILRIEKTSGASSVIVDQYIGNGQQLYSPVDMVSDYANDRVFAANRLPNEIIEIDLNTANRTLVSSNSKGSGQGFSLLSALSFDAANNRLLVLDGGTHHLLAVDITTGDRLIVSEQSETSAVRFERPSDMFVDYSNGVAYVIDTNLSALVAINLNDGSRSIVSDNTEVGSGVSFSSPKSIAPLGDTAVVASHNDKLISVDLVSGNRVELMSLNALSAGGFSGFNKIRLDQHSGRLLITDDAGSLYDADLEAESASLISKNTAGPDGAFSFSLYRAMAFSETAGHLILVPLLFDDYVELIDTETFTLEQEPTEQATDLILGVADIELDHSSNILYIADNGKRRISTINRENGEINVVSGSNVGQGESLGYLQELALDLENDRVFAVSLVAADRSYSILAINLNNGDRALVASDSIGSGPVIEEPSAVLMDSENNQLLVLDNGANALVAIDLSNNNRQVISDNLNGAGLPFETPTDMIFGVNDDVVLVSDSGANTIAEVNLSSGDRRLISGANQGRGAPLSGVVRIELDTKVNRLFLLSEDYQGVMTVDLNSGDRVLSKK